MRLALVVTAVLSLGLFQTATAKVYNVNSIASLRAALADTNLSPGDEIDIAYDTYAVYSTYDPKHWFKKGGTVSQPIRIVGLPGPNGEKPVFDATGTPIERGLFYLWDYAPNYVFKNLEIRNVRGNNTQSNNAAAAYILADNITFRNCYSHHNDNGWFATTSAHNTLLEYCHTAYNGKPAGASGDMTHNHYMHSTGLTIRGCYIHDSTEGQNFKSRASSVVFEYNWVQNAGSYEWELASNNKNNSVLIGNVIIKRPNAGNRRIIQLSDGTVTDATSGTLTMINNTIISTGSNDPYVTTINVATTNVVMYNNVFAGPSNRLLDWSGSGTPSGSNNWLPTGASVPAGVINTIFGSDPGFINQTGRDFHIQASSPLRNAGMDNPQWLNASNVLETRVPSLEYKADWQTSVRPNNGTLDIGAYEHIYPGDVDRDSAVGLNDLKLLVAAWNSMANGPTWNPNADVDGDGAVILADLKLLVANWNMS